jgi:hypothetical protein
VSDYSNFQVRPETPEEAAAFDLCAERYAAWMAAKDRSATLKYINCRAQYPGLPPCKECLAEAKLGAKLAAHQDLCF